MESAYDLSAKLIHERVFPDKALDILSRTTSKTQGTGVINSENIAQQISEITEVPVTAISQEESEKLLNLEKDLSKNVIGQDHALQQISRALKRNRVGIRDENKPIASFFICRNNRSRKNSNSKNVGTNLFW